MGYNVSILGFGAQGRVIAKLMDLNSSVNKISVGDVRGDLIKTNIQGYERVEGYKVDASNYSELLRFIRDSDVVVNAVIPEFNINIIKAALENNVNYIDMAFGPPYENLDEQMRLDESFKREGITAITASGFSPGITNILIGNVADDLDVIDSIKIVCGGISDSDVLFSTWSPETMIEDCLADTYVYKYGELVRMPPFSGRETIDLPIIGRTTAFNHIHEEMFTLWRFLGKKINYMEFKFGGPSIEMIHMLYTLGLLNEEPINIKGVEVSPLDVFLSVMPRPPSEDMLVKWVSEKVVRDAKVGCLTKIEGYKNGKRTSVDIHLVSPSIIDVVNKMPMANHVSYITSSSCYTLADMLGKEEIRDRGVYVPEALNRDVRESFIDRITSLDPHIMIGIKLKMEL